MLTLLVREVLLIALIFNLQTFAFLLRCVLFVLGDEDKRGQPILKKTVSL